MPDLARAVTGGVLPLRIDHEKRRVRVSKQPGDDNSGALAGLGLRHDQRVSLGRARNRNAGVVFKRLVVEGGRRTGLAEEHAAEFASARGHGRLSMSKAGVAVVIGERGQLVFRGLGCLPCPEAPNHDQVGGKAAHEIPPARAETGIAGILLEQQQERRNDPDGQHKS